MQQRDANSDGRGHGCGLRHRDCGGVPHHGGACHRGIGSGNAESTQLSLGFFSAILGSWLQNPPLFESETLKQKY